MCRVLPRHTPRTHPCSSGLFLQKKKTSRVIQRALDDAWESRASPMGSRKGFGKGTLAMAARGELPPRGRCGSTCRVGWGSFRCCSPRCLCQERRLCSPAVTLPPSRGSPSAFCLPLAPRCAQCGGQKIPCTHVRSCSIPQSSLHRPQEGADRGTSALGDAPVQASGSQGSVISTQLDQELHWGGGSGAFYSYFFPNNVG